VVDRQEEVMADDPSDPTGFETDIKPLFREKTASRC